MAASFLYERVYLYKLQTRQQVVHMKKDAIESIGLEDHGFRQRISWVIEQAGGPTAFAKKTGLSRAVVDKYRNGISDPSRLRLVNISRSTNVDIEWLATGYGSPTPKGIPALQDHDQKALQDGTFRDKTLEEQLAYEKAYAAGRLDPEAVKNAVKMLKRWEDNNSKSISPEEMADAVFLLSRTANEDGKIPETILDSLMKFKGSFPHA